VCPWDNTRPRSALCASPTRDLVCEGKGRRKHNIHARAANVKADWLPQDFRCPGGFATKGGCGRANPRPRPGLLIPGAHACVWLTSGDGSSARPPSRVNRGKVGGVCVCVGGGGALLVVRDLRRVRIGGGGLGLPPAWVVGEAWLKGARPTVRCVTHGATPWALACRAHAARAHSRLGGMRGGAWAAAVHRPRRVTRPPRPSSRHQRSRRRLCASRLCRRPAASASSPRRVVPVRRPACWRTRCSTAWSA